MQKLRYPDPESDSAPSCKAFWAYRVWRASCSTLGGPVQVCVSLNTWQGQTGESSYAMARRPRSFLAGLAHHVILRGNNRTPTFASEEDYLFFLLCLGKACREHVVAIHALVLMTNHVHLLVTPATPQSLPKAMQSLGCRYVQHFNHARGRTGTLWEGRYRSAMVDSTKYFLVCMCYIERNPERARIVDRLEDYRWSSYRANALGADCGVVLTPHPAYVNLGRTDATRQAAYRRLFRRPLPPEDLEVVRQATNRRLVLEDHDAGQAGSDPGLTLISNPAGRVRPGSDPD